MTYIRTPMAYDGRRPTFHHIKNVIAYAKKEIDMVTYLQNFKNGLDIFLTDAFKNLIGEANAIDVIPLSFVNNELLVFCTNKSLVEVLRFEKIRLLNELRARCPQHNVRNLKFTISENLRRKLKIEKPLEDTYKLEISW